jgi:hypothetical protein
MPGFWLGFVQRPIKQTRKRKKATLWNYANKTIENDAINSQIQSDTLVFFFFFFFFFFCGTGAWT